MCDDHADFNGRGRCAATGKVGAVFALQSSTAAGTTTTLTATFGTTSPPSDAGCVQQGAGASCIAFSCPRTPAARAPGPPAGAITAKSNGGALVTNPAADGTYNVASLNRALWTLPNAALAFSAAGGMTPVFGETFCGPPGATITKPASPPGAGLTIDRAADLALQWTGGTVGDLEVVLRDDTTSATTIFEVRCFFVGASSQATVPKAALQLMPAGTHSVASYIWVREIGIASGGTCVELTGIATNRGAGNVPWNGNAAFQ